MWRLGGIKIIMRYLFVLLFFVSIPAQAQSYGIAMHGDMKYAADFSHFDYVNPSAPKGGSYSDATIGS